MYFICLPVPDMAYYAFSGTFNPAQSILFAFSALKLFVGNQEEQLPVKKLVICLE